MGILFGPTDLWLFRKEIMLEILLQSIDEIKNESVFVSGRS